MATETRSIKKAPVLELRMGGLHLTIQRIPHSILTLLAGIAGSMGGAIWLGR